MINSQAILFFIFLINGSIIGILFDFFRILRKSFKTGIIITSIEDILFWIITGAIILYCIFVFNNGVIRGYMFIGILFGIIFYSLTVSKYFIKINVFIINIIKRFIIRFIFIPLNFIKKFANFAKKLHIKEGFSKKV